MLNATMLPDAMPVIRVLRGQRVTSVNQAIHVFYSLHISLGYCLTFGKKITNPLLIVYSLLSLLR